MLILNSDKNDKDVYNIIVSTGFQHGQHHCVVFLGKTLNSWGRFAWYDFDTCDKLMTGLQRELF